ncbi:chemotaxis protein CheB [Telluribacter sp.]|jgi:two-component system chemotaxis response regulator CheB|uniref:chemotaxis protein CheB n=1 Tax=Telluribacter sp. TaxID=1978767 RepID=UPI002E10CF36|nr:chemotaxis protein CheB [Telluribacter sp.]
MTTRDIIVVGASSGGVPALKAFVNNLPKDFKGSVFIVLHIPTYTESRLPEILSNAGPLEAVHPGDGEEIEPGKIYIARNDHHLLLQEGKVMVKRGPKENRFRPSIDALFRSAAYVYSTRVVGIIMSGILNDGASGLWTIKEMGGLAIVQLPDDAEQPQLPINVLELVEADYVLTAEDMGPLISGLIKEPIPEKYKFSEEALRRLKTEVIIATKDDAFEMGIMEMGELTPFTCPECHGALVRLVEGKIIRFRCHTGHAYTASSLLAEVSESVEKMLWQSMRGLEEMNMLLKNISDHFAELEDSASAALFREKAEESGERARVIHDSIFKQNHYSEDIRLDKDKKTHDHD